MTVMPAQAGIQRDQVQASIEFAWIPAFAGMTLPLPIPFKLTKTRFPHPNFLPKKYLIFSNSKSSSSGLLR